jgi:hypothetical protein
MPTVDHRPSERAKTKPILVASASVTYHQARKAKARITLTRKGRRLLQHATHLRLIAASSFAPAVGPTTTIQTPVKIGQ